MDSGILLRRRVAFAALALQLIALPAHTFAADCGEASRLVSETLREGLGSEASTASLRKAVTLCPELAEGHFHLGVSLLQQHQADDAVTALKRALDLKRDPSFLIAIGNAYAEQRQFDRARDAFQESLKFDAKSVRAMQGLAAVAIAQGKFPAAEETLRKAIQIAPDEAGLFYNLGLVLEQTGRGEEALESFRAATLRRPSFFGAQLHLGTAALRLGRFEDAERALRPLTLQDSQNANVWLALGAASEGLGQLDSALSSVDKALASDPQLVAAQTNRAIILIKLGRVNEGRDLLVSLSTSHAGNAPIWSALGWGYLQAEQLELAQSALTKAIELDPNDGFAQNNLGVVYSLKGDTEHAQHAFQRARELRPTLKEPAANIQSVVE